MNEVFDQYGAYYDLLYRDKNYAAEADYVVKVLRKSLPDAKRILELGSGTGRHGRLLAERGFNVAGIEASKAMVMSGPIEKQKDFGEGSFHSERGDIRSIRIQMNFDAVISLFHVISYQTSNDDLLKVFGNAARHLKPQGIFFFDVWHAPAVLSQGPAVRVKRAENEKIRLVRVAEPLLDTSTSIVTVTYTVFVESKSDGRIRTFNECHHMRYLFPTEMEMLAHQAGLAVEHSEEFLTGATPSEQTWGVAYLLRKRD